MRLRRAPTYPYHSNVQRKLNFSPFVACLAALILILTAIKAQDKAPATTVPFNPAVYRVGERLTYDVSFSQFVSAAHVELFVAGRGQYFGRDGIQLRAHVETSGVINVALLALNHDYTTYVDATTGLPYRTQQVVRAAGRTTEASSDYNQPAGTEAIPAKLSTGGFPGTFDFVSAVYRLRAMPLSEGTSFSITVHHESQEYQADIKIVGRQLIKTNVGSFNTLVARVSASSGPLMNIRVYLSEDEWHVPVLITAKLRDGELRAELAASQLTTPAAVPVPTQSISPQPSGGRPPITTTVPPGSSSAGGALPNLPFKVGEQLNYQVYLGNAEQSIGTLSFSVAARGRYFNRDGLLITATAQTTNAGARVYFVNDKFSSYVDPETLLPFRTEMNIAEGKWRSTRAYNVDQDRGAVTTDTRQRIEIPVGTHDLISAIYAIRTFDLLPKRQNAISILAITQPRTLLITAQQRETITLGGQQIPALLLTLATDDGKLEPLQLRIWVEDDWRHLPLRIAAMTPLGPVRADLAIMPTTPR